LKEKLNRNRKKLKGESNRKYKELAIIDRFHKLKSIGYIKDVKTLYDKQKRQT